MKQILTILAIMASLYLFTVSQTDETKDEWVHTMADYLVP